MDFRSKKLWDCATGIPFGHSANILLAFDTVFYSITQKRFIELLTDNNYYDILLL